MTITDAVHQAVLKIPKRVWTPDAFGAVCRAEPTGALTRHVADALGAVLVDAGSR
jgi:hypothetical protein